MKVILTSTAIVLAALVPATAWAQQAPVPAPDSATPQTSDDVGIGEIVVTAQRREERLQDVPVAITAVTSEQLSTGRIETSYDLPKVTPGLTVNKSAVYAVPFLRGVGSTNILIGDEPSVSTYVDGFYKGPALAAILPFNNIQRIEVLKGPQGTLYGRNATGGLINIITTDPLDNFFAKGSVGYGNFETFEADGYVTGPLGESIRADLSVRYKNQGKGFVRNLFTGNRIGTDDVFAARAKVLVDFSDRVSLTLTGDYAYAENDMGAAQSNFPGTRPIGALVGGQSSTRPYYTYQNIDPIASVRAWGATATLRAELDSVDLVSLTQYRAYESRNTLDADGSSDDGRASQVVPGVGTIGLATLSFVSPTKLPYFWTQEFQILSNGDGPFSWIVGAFGLKSLEKYDPLSVQFNVAGPAIAITQSQGETEALAGFAQGTYAFDNGFSITLGGRYNHERKRMVGSITSGASVTTTDKKTTFNSFTYRGSIDYRFSPEVLVFASASKGFKSGAFNTNSIDDQPAVDPENLYAYELGIKADPSRNLRVNFTSFYYDYKDIQFYAQGANTGLATLQNAAAAELYGAEIDVVAVPVRGLTLRASASIEHSEYTSFAGAQVYVPGPSAGQVQEFVDATGNDVIRTPTFTGNLGATYEADLPNGSGLTFAANVYHNAGYNFDPAGVVQQDPYTLVDASITWTAPDDRFSIMGWVKNLTDELYIESITSGTRNNRVGYAPPQTFGVTLKAQIN